MTDLEKWIQRINDTRGISQAEKQRLRQRARSLANADGSLGPSDRETLRQELNAAQGSENQNPGTPVDGNPGTPGTPDPVEVGTTQACETMFGPPQAGYRWEGAVYIDANGNLSHTCRQVFVESTDPDSDNDGTPDSTDPDDNNDGTPDDGQTPTDPSEPPTTPEPSGPDPFEEWQKAQEQERRTSASSFFRGLLTQFGFTQSDVDGLMSMFDNWLAEGFNNEAIMMKFRGTEIYTRRFPGMRSLTERGQAITEAEYIRLESAYRGVLSSYGLPAEFFDSPDDYGRFIANNVSPDEVGERAATGMRIVQSADRRILDELGEYYGVTQGTALAYLLDADKAQDLIRRQVRAATIGGSGERFGFNMQRGYSERLGATSLGQTIDGMSPEAAARLDQSFTTARRVADRERILANIDTETFADSDAVDAMFGDLGKQLASQERAKRERARFMGTSGIGGTSLSQQRNL